MAPGALHTERTPSAEQSLAEPLLTATDAARLLSVRTSWIYEATRDGRLPHMKIGRHTRFLRSDLEDYVRQQRVMGRIGA